jgi:hypothetical protein
MKKGTKFYTITMEIDIALAPNAMVLPDPECVAAAVRNYMRAHLSTTTTKGGYSFHPSTIHVEAKLKEAPTNE